MKYKPWMQVVCCLFGSLTAQGADPILKNTSTHPIQYYLTLPRDWRPDRKWPLVVTIDGSGKSWLYNARTFAKVRDEKNYPFIIATPLVLTNGGSDLRHDHAYSYSSVVWDEVERFGRCNFDIGGLEAIVNDLETRYGADHKYFLSGWSAGGHLAWATILRRPEVLMAAALSGPNYIGRCMTIEVDAPVPVSSSPDRVNLPVRAFLGDLDATGVSAQIGNALEMAKAHGYNNVMKIVVPQTGHAPMPDQVLDFFYSVIRR